MKKIISILLVVILLASISVVSFAQSSPSQETKPPVAPGNSTTPPTNAGGNAGYAGAGAGAGAKEEAEEGLIITPLADEKSLTEEEQASMDAAVEACEAIEDLKAEFEDIAAAAGDLEVRLGGAYYVTHSKGAAGFPATRIFEEDELENMIGVLFFAGPGADSAPVFLKLNGDKVTYPGEGTCFDVFVVPAESAGTGETVPYALVIAAVVLAGAAGWFFASSRKVKD